MEMKFVNGFVATVLQTPKRLLEQLINDYVHKKEFARPLREQKSNEKA